MKEELHQGHLVISESNVSAGLGEKTQTGGCSLPFPFIVGRAGESHEHTEHNEEGLCVTTSHRSDRLSITAAQER